MAKNIKKLHELFDNEDLHSKDEVRFITGELRDEVEKIIKKGEIHDFKDVPEIAKMMKQLSINFPFLTNAMGVGLGPLNSSVVYVFSDTPSLNNSFVIEISLGN